MAKYRLKIKRLDFVSPVDTPAQETARVVLTKGAGLKFSAFAPVVKLSETTGADGEPIGLVFCWAVTEKANGQDYFDLQDDQVMADDDLIRAALDYVKRGAMTDEMHDGDADGFAPFVMPMTAEVAKAFGVSTKTTGLMVGLKPSADVFAKFQSGEYTGVSIEGVGERTKVAAMQTKCEKCGSFAKDDAKTCPGCGAKMPEQKRAPVGKSYRDASGGYVETEDGIECVVIGKRAPSNYDADARSNVLKGTWSTADVDDFPDSSFLYIEAGGSKDAAGKTTPRSLRHFPYRDATGKIDLPHLRDAIGRIPQSSLPATLRNKLQVKAEKLLAAQHAKDDTGKRAPDVRKAVLATTACAGHAHLLSDNGEPDGYTDGATMPGADDGGWHQHPWLRSPDQTILILEAEGHAHEVMAPEDLTAIVESPRANDVDEDDTPQKRARKSTHQSNGSSVTTKKDESMIILSEAQHAHYLKLSDKDREDFVKKSSADRDAEIKKALDADPVVYKTADGIEIRKSQGDLMVSLAKRADEAHKTAIAQAQEIEAAKLEKRADTEIAGFAKSTKVRAAVLKAIDGIADEATRKEAHDALKGLVMQAGAALKLLGKRSPAVVDPKLGEGATKTGDDPVAADDPAAQLEKRVREVMVEQKLPTYEQAYAKAVTSDPKARELYLATQSHFDTDLETDAEEE